MASIQFTTIKHGRVEMLIADEPDREAATVWLQFLVPCAADKGQRLSTIQATALRAARELIAEEMQRIANPPNPKA